MMKVSAKNPMPGVELAEKDLDKVERLLEREAGSEVRLVMEVGRHILGSGGKRFRPLLTILSGKMIGFRNNRELCSYAAGMEFAHTSTLLHDDVIDEADMRRGASAANRLWGNAPSIIVGDYLLFKSFALMLAGNNLRVIHVMTSIAVEMAEGEAYQLAQKSRVNLTEKQYERIIKAKTALLIQASCQIPAIALDLSAHEEKALASFGYRLGLAFQIVDDVLDYVATDLKWGKQIGKDFLEGKATLPLILAHRKADAAGRKTISELFAKKTRTRADLKRVLCVMRDTGCLETAKAQAKKNVEHAKKSLAVFKDNAGRKALIQLADYVIARTV